MTAHEELQQKLARALAFAGDTHTVDDVIKGVREGRLQAWTAGDSFVVTTITRAPQKSFIDIFLAVGDLDAVLSLQPQVEAFGREQGCSEMRMIGRRGWGKVLPERGWKRHPAVIYKRSL
jgi:hypothetical protein